MGEQCTYGIEVHGRRGALAWDFRRMGELRLCLDQDYQNASYVTRYVAPGDGELINFQPGSGIAMGYDDLKVIEAHRLVQSIATGQSGRSHDPRRAESGQDHRCDGRVCRLPHLDHVHELARGATPWTPAARQKMRGRAGACKGGPPSE